ncbi:T9SS type A sorting domain-containing protein [bacterium]|nr:T9SS type A sorting domain-containing protein [bacterium]
MNRCGSSLFLVLALVLMALPGVVRPGFAGDENWWEGFSPWGIEGRVYSVVVHGGQVYAGGSFQTAGGEPAANIARWDGVRWRPVGEGLDGMVNVLISGTSALLAGGVFTQAGGTPAANVARFEGGFWYPLGNGLDAQVQDLYFEDGTLVACGHFDQSGSIATGQVATFDGIDWHPYPALYPISYGVAFCLAEDHLGRIWTGGWWMYDSIWSTLNCLAYVDGGRWRRPGGTVGPDELVQCLKPMGETMYLGGSFANVDGRPSEHFAYWTPGGGFHPVSGLSSDVYDIVEYQGILAVGHDDGVTPYSPVDGWLSPLGTLQYTRSLAVDGTRLLAGGIFPLDSYEEGVALWDGEDWVRLGGGLYAPWPSHDDYRVFALCEHGDGIVAGGRFTIFRLRTGTPNCQNVGLWTGEFWKPLGSGLDGDVEALIVHGDDLIAGGGFVTAGGEPAARVARWDGAAWRQLGGGIPGAGGDVLAFAETDSLLYAAGSFSRAQGSIANHLAVWDGVAWSALSQELPQPVNALAVYEGDLIAGGEFLTAGGFTVNRIARWDGSAWHPLGAGLDGQVSALGVDRSGERLYVGGAFTTAGGAPADGIASWDGASWSAMGAGVGGSDYPYPRAILETHNGVFVGGDFGSAGGAPAPGVALWNGSGWSSLGTGVAGGSGGIPSVRALLVHEHELYLGGDFSTAGGKPSTNMARWQEAVTAVRGGDLPAAGLVSLQVSPNPFNSRAVVAFTLPASDPAEVAVYDLRGRRVRTLQAGSMSSGRHEVIWDGKDGHGQPAPSGVYLVRVSVGGDNRTAKAVLVR